jgi:hypothetical protein
VSNRLNATALPGTAAKQSPKRRALILHQVRTEALGCDQNVRGGGGRHSAVSAQVDGQSHAPVAAADFCDEAAFAMRNRGEVRAKVGLANLRMMAT